MRWKNIITVLGLFFTMECAAQQAGEMEMIAAFLGVASEEDLSDEEVERMTELLRRPLKINLASRSRLVSSGLLTGYQAASLIDYRQRFGHVLSFAELSLLDGFGKSYVEMLKPFVSLDTGGDINLAAPIDRGVRNELSLRGGCRHSLQEYDWQYGAKYTLDVSESFIGSIGISRSRTAKSAAPSYYTASALYDFRKVSARLILGDFNARFGQGLTAWNGAFINSLNTPSGFMKKSSGLSAVKSFTGSTANTGLAAEFDLGHFTMSTALGLPGVKNLRQTPEKLGVSPLVNIRWWNRNGVVGLTSVYETSLFNNSQSHVKSSIDAALCIRGVNIFGEAAYQWVDKIGQFVLGTDFSPDEDVRLAALAGWTQGKQWQSAASGEFAAGMNRNHKGTFSIETLCHLVPKDKLVAHSVQVKSQVRWEWKAMDYLTLRLRMSDRYRTWGLPHRTEVRLETISPVGIWSFDSRFIVLKSRYHAILGHLDVSCRTNSLTAHLRAGIFRVDHWDDRIYVYEYDAPGTFNVPAYYGRGVWTSAVLSYKVQRFLRLYLRASYISYPLMDIEKKKPGRAELKLQSVFKF